MTRYDSAVLWPWFETITVMAFVGFVIVAPNVAVFTRMREKAWEEDQVVDGKRVRAKALASIWPYVEVVVEAHVPPGELRARRKRAHVRALEDALRADIHVSHVECTKTAVRVVVRPRPLGLAKIGSGTLVERVMPFVNALESAHAVDAEGGPEGKPFAVRATTSE